MTVPYLYFIYILYLGEKMSERQSFSDWIDDAARALKRSDDIMARVTETQQRWWEELAGPFLQEMVRSRRHAEKYLEHGDPPVRMVALSVLQDVWKARSSTEFSNRCEQMVLNDPDPEVQAVAITALGACYSNTNNGHIGRLLARIVHDESSAPEVGLSAYQALFDVRGRLASSTEMDAQLLEDFRFPEGVDWAF
ncbi:MAG: hypothetical protein ACYSWU_22105, partial [Planctomycetota bacterium]